MGATRIDPTSWAVTPGFASQQCLAAQPNNLEAAAPNRALSDDLSRHVLLNGTPEAASGLSKEDVGTSGWPIWPRLE